MPKYTYKCLACSKDFEIYHSMSEVIDECIMCEAQTVQRIPSLSFTTTTKNNSGQLVKEYIEEAKASVLEQQRKMTEDLDG
jgi:putative FmdB family regulatory protein